MVKQKYILLIVILFLVIKCVSLGSKSKQNEVSDAVVPDKVIPELPKYYDAIYPKNDPALYFEELSQIVKRIQVTLYYKTFYFSDGQNITPDILKYQKIQKLSRDNHFFNFSKIGTAIPIAKNDDGILLMTCAHVVDVQDTIYTFRKGLNIPKNTYLISVTLLEKVEYFIFESPLVHEFETLIKSKDSDLAFIRAITEATPTTSVKVLPYKLGKTSDLQWGSHIFMFGFPINNRMISHGIVSKPDDDGMNGFLSNAYMNKGFSGGLVVAIRGDVPNFEWVGMSSAISSEYEYTITPNKNQESYFEDGQLYSDSLFLEKKLSINHGISKAVSADEIKKFMIDNYDQLYKWRYDLTSFYSDN